MPHRQMLVMLVLIASTSAFVLSLPMWLVGDVALVPWLGALWGFGNLAFLKIGLSFATELQITIVVFRLRTEKQIEADAMATPEQ